MQCKICSADFESSSYKKLTCSDACSRENKKHISLESYYRRKGHNVPIRTRVYNPDVARLTKKEQRAKYRKKHKDKIKERSRIYNAKTYDIRKNYHLKKYFNLTLEDYNKILESQNNCCAICFKNQDVFTKKLAVDHCHTTGVIRGLLCDTCNRAIGMLADSTELLQSAINYLKK